MTVKTFAIFTAAVLLAGFSLGAGAATETRPPAPVRDVVIGVGCGPARETRLYGAEDIGQAAGECKLAERHRLP